MADCISLDSPRGDLPDGDVDEPPLKTAKTEHGKHQMKHYELFAEADSCWPRNYADQPHLHVGGFWERQCEMLVCLDAVAHADPRDDPGGVPHAAVCGRLPFFVGRLMGNKSKDFNWLYEDIATITESCSIAIRYAPKGTKHPVIRLVTGLELMAITGWPTDMWAPGIPLAVQDLVLLASLRGHAFSAFDVAPAALTAMAVAGTNQQL